MRHIHGIHVDIYYTYERIRVADRCETRTACVRCIELHGTAGTPHQAMPCHATPLRGTHLTLPAGPADADADFDTTIAASIVNVRTCVYAYTIVRTATKLLVMHTLLEYICVDSRD